MEFLENLIDLKWFVIKNKECMEEDFHEELLDEILDIIDRLVGG